MRKQGLLLGNGLFRNNPRAQSWIDVIGDLANDLGEPLPDSYPLDLYFDYLVNKSYSKRGDLIKAITYRLNDRLVHALKEESDVGHGLKRYIADFFNEQSAIPQQELTRGLLMSKHPEIILTTNYDRRIETALGFNGSQLEFDSGPYETAAATCCGPARLKGGQEWSCSINHCHGTIDAPASICIGRKDYARQLSLIEKWSASRGSRCSEDGDTWYERFLDTDISIIGLGLGFEEIDLWHLLEIRVDILSSVDADEPNRISYFSPRLYGSCSSPSELARNHMLTALGIEVIEVGGRDYPECYERICRIAASRMEMAMGGRTS